MMVCFLHVFNSLYFIKSNTIVTTVGFVGSQIIREGDSSSVEIAYQEIITQPFTVIVESYQCSGDAAAARMYVLLLDKAFITMICISIAGADYQPVNEILTFTSNRRSQFINIVTMQDDVFEGREPERICLNITNYNEPCPNYLMIGVGEVTVIIKEDDCKFATYVYLHSDTKHLKHKEQWPSKVELCWNADESIRMCSIMH